MLCFEFGFAYCDSITLLVCFGGEGCPDRDWADRPWWHGMAWPGRAGHGMARSRLDLPRGGLDRTGAAHSARRRHPVAWEDEVSAPQFVVRGLTSYSTVECVQYL